MYIENLDDSTKNILDTKLYYKVVGYKSMHRMFLLQVNNDIEEKEMKIKNKFHLQLSLSLPPHQDR